MEWSDRAAVARRTAWRKGGNLARSALGPEVPHHGADRMVGGVESPGQLVEGLVLDEERAEDLVATMQNVVGFEEEATAGFVLHARISRIGRVTFPKDQGSDGRTDLDRVQGGTLPRWPQAGVLTRRTPVQQGLSAERSGTWGEKEERKCEELPPQRTWDSSGIPEEK
jgi:hypothetical protein